MSHYVVRVVSPINGVRKSRRKDDGARSSDRTIGESGHRILEKCLIMTRFSNSPTTWFQGHVRDGMVVAKRARMNRRGFCINACQIASLVAVGSFLEGCGGSSPTSPSDSQPQLRTVNGTVANNAVTVNVTSDSPLATVGGAALVQSNSGAFLVARRRSGRFQRDDSGVHPRTVHRQRVRQFDVSVSMSWIAIQHQRQRGEGTGNAIAAPL